MASAPLLGATVAAGGATFTGVAVVVAETFNLPVNVNLIVGGAVVSIVCGAIVVVAKTWLEKFITKLIDMPTKQQLFEFVETTIKSAIDEHAKGFGKSLHDIELQIAEIQTRHETEDRLAKQQRTGETHRT